MPTLTAYPDAHPETTTVDGYVAQEVAATAGYGATWAATRGGAGTGAIPSLAGLYGYVINSHQDTDKWQGIFRSILLFDCSSIPSGVPIVSVTLTIYGNSKHDYLGIAPDVNVYESSPASNTNIVAGDFDSLSTTPLSTAIAYDDFVVDPDNPTAANAFVLNAAGLAIIVTAIAGDGIVKLGLRNANYDVANIEPTWSSALISQLYAHSADKAGLYRPKLVINYASSYPTGSGTRVTSLTHRYDRGTYTLEMNLGEVVADFGLPEWEPKPKPTIPKTDEEKDEEAEGAERGTIPPLPPPVPPPPIIRPPVPPVTETGIPGVTMPFTTRMPTAAEMLEYAGMSQAEYDKIIRQGKILKALKEFGPITGPADLAKFKARYPELGIGVGVPKIGDPDYMARMGLLGAEAVPTLGGSPGVTPKMI